MSLDLSASAEFYAQLLESVHGRREAPGAAEEAMEAAQDSPDLQELQCLWMAGQLGHEGETAGHGHVSIVDSGLWNRGEGPAFLRAEIEIQGVRVRGDIDIAIRAQDWESAGKGNDAAFNDVALLIVMEKPPEGCFIRNSLHQEIPLLPLPARPLRNAAGTPRCTTPTAAGLCRIPLSGLPLPQTEKLLQAAAAFRAQRKRRLFELKAASIGKRQAWYEALAETLGYHINKLPMQILARRARLHELSTHAESILFGTAGFLVPVLPEKAPQEARCYHRIIWDGWWPLRPQYELTGRNRIPWQFSPLRPQNHPHRRVAALAVAASRWKEIEPLLSPAAARPLTQLLTSLTHPYWDTHCSLPSANSPRPMALIGKERVQDFLINHLYPYDASAPAWATYLSLKTRQIARTVARSALNLFGQREDIAALLPYCYAQQGLLQLLADFCAASTRTECLFPEKLAQWGIRAAAPSSPTALN